MALDPSAWSRTIVSSPPCLAIVERRRPIGGIVFHLLRRRKSAQGILIMNKLTQKLRRFLTSEDGPTAVEYAVMLALIVVVCLGAIQTIGTRANTTFTSVATALQGSSSSS